MHFSVTTLVLLVNKAYAYGYGDGSVPFSGGILPAIGGLKEAKTATDFVLTCPLLDSSNRCSTAPGLIARGLEASEDGFNQVITSLGMSTDEDITQYCSNFVNLFKQYTQLAISFAPTFKKFACEPTKSALVAQRVDKALKSAVTAAQNMETKYAEQVKNLAQCAALTGDLKTAVKQLQQNNADLEKYFDTLGVVNCL